MMLERWLQIVRTANGDGWRLHSAPDEHRNVRARTHTVWNTTWTAHDKQEAVVKLRFPENVLNVDRRQQSEL